MPEANQAEHEKSRDQSKAHDAVTHRQTPDSRNQQDAPKPPFPRLVNQSDHDPHQRRKGQIAPHLSRRTYDDGG